MQLSRLQVNVFSNYFATIWLGALGLLVVPMFLNRMGPALWGQVAICMTLQSLFNFMDAGLAQIMPRNIAKVAGNEQLEYREFRIFSRIYLYIGLFVVAVGECAVDWIVGTWYAEAAGASAEFETAIRLVFVQFFFQFTNNAHTGFWNGVQEQKFANQLQCLFATMRNITILLSLGFYRDSLLAYLVPYLAFVMLEWACNRVVMISRFKHLARERLVFSDYLGLLREVGVLGFGVLVGILVSQADRLVLSKVVAVDQFGTYAVVASLGLAFMQLQQPLLRALFPHMVSASAGMRSTGLVMLCSALPCLVAALFVPHILQLWLGSGAPVAQDGVLPLRFLLLGVGLNAVYNVILLEIYAQGRGSLVAKINLLSIFVIYPTGYFMATRFGIVAGGLCWIVSSSLQLMLGIAWKRGLLH